MMSLTCCFLPRLHTEDLPVLRDTVVRHDERISNYNIEVCRLHSEVYCDGSSLCC